ncbi:MAG: site-specific integrase [Mariniphaga sp.]
MIKDCFISIYLDTRRKKKNDKFPVKIRVFTSEPRMQKLYPTKFEFTEFEFKQIWETSKPRREFQADRLKLSSIEKLATDLAEKLSPFSFEKFEEIFLYNVKPSDKDAVFLYKQAIAEYKRERQIGTASNYECSLNSLLKFHGEEKLPFISITKQWLKNYENYLVDEKKRSLTTVGIYLRPLRAIYHKAIEAKLINADNYPFGRLRDGKYTIPAPKKVKKALAKDQLGILFKANPLIPEQQKAKAYWFFSYACNGMNFKDIALLQYSDISGDTLCFSRAKTANTHREQPKVVTYLNSFTLSVIEQYGNPKTNTDTYVFPIIDHSSSPEEQHRQLKNFIRLVNQHFKNFASSVGVNEKISTYWARHSFATIAVQDGASLEFASEALGHSSLSTTKGYFAGFEDKKKREISKKMMEF